MSKLIIPKTNSTYRESAIPKKGDLLFDETINKLVVGDGVTPGGIVINVSGGTAGEDVTGGFGITVVDNEVSMTRFSSIESLVSGGTIYAGHHYKITATSGSTVNAELFERGAHGLDATLEIYLNGTGYIHTGNNLVIKGQLEPDAINNCVVRFHDGDAVLEVLDNIGGYIVTKASGSTAGTLVYGLTDVSSGYSPYIVFNQELNGTPIDFAGTEVTDERHVVGNGYENTILCGTVSIGSSTAKVTVANLSLQDVGITGGTLTLGDAFIPSGSTVAVSGGGLALEKVSGNGGVIDLGGETRPVTESNNIAMAGVTLLNGSGYNGGAVVIGSYTLLASSSVFSNCTAAINGGAIFAHTGANLTLTDTVVSGNHANRGGGIYSVQGQLTLNGCTVSGNTATDRGHDVVKDKGTLQTSGSVLGEVYLESSAQMVIIGSNTVKKQIRAFIPGSAGRSGTVLISSGAIVDLTGNTNATPIAPGGGITFERGGATVYPSAGQASAYMLGGMTVPQIGNTNVVNLNNGRVALTSNSDVFASNVTIASGGLPVLGNGGCVTGVGVSGAFVSCTISGARPIADVAETYGGGVYLRLSDVTISGCTITDNWAQSGGGCFFQSGCNIRLIECVVSGNTQGYYGDVGIGSGAIVTMQDSTIDRSRTDGTLTFVSSNTITTLGGGGSAIISSGASINLTSSIFPGGGVVVDGGCTVNGVSVAGGTYTSIVSSGGSAVINQ